MTKMVSVRLQNDEAEALEHEALRLNVSASDLLRDGLRTVLARAAAHRDLIAYERSPMTDAELVDSASQAWLPDEDWSLWHDRINP
jgi:Arc/MetJ-type ribon-helix-helix transcriptional regulator